MRRGRGKDITVNGRPYQLESLDGFLIKGGRVNHFNIDTNFNYTYQKTVDQVKEAAKKKIGQLKDKIAEREQRIAQTREANKIDDKALISLLMEARKDQQNRTYKASYTTTSLSNSKGGEDGEGGEITVAAGVIMSLLTESDNIQTEQGQIKKLALIFRNLAPVVEYADNGQAYTDDKVQLSESEAEYLGF